MRMRIPATEAGRTGRGARADGVHSSSEGRGVGWLCITPRQLVPASQNNRKCTASAIARVLVAPS